MKFLFDVFPGLVFLAVLFFYPSEQPVYQATIALIGVTVAQVVFLWLKNKAVQRQYLIICALVVILGTVTLLLKDPQFIKWKPTLVFWLFGIACLLSEYLWTGISLPRRLLQKQFNPPVRKWVCLNISCTVFFFLLGLLNLYIAYQFDTKIWALFKTFGIMGINMVFMVGVIIYLYPYMTVLNEEEK